MSVFSLLGVAFIVLKLMEVIAWSWWWVLLPFYGGVVVILVLLVLAALASK